MMNELCERLYKLLSDTPQPAAALAERAGIKEAHATSPRTRDIIRELVNRGAPIIGTPDGYRLGSREEVLKEVERLMRRAGATVHRAIQLLETAERMAE